MNDLVQAVPETDARTRTSDALDAVGIILLAGAVAWAFFSGTRAGSEPGPVAGLYLVASLAFVSARWLGERVGRWVVPALVALFAAGLLLGDVHGTLSGAPHRGALGYANATAALAVQAVVACAIIAISRRGVFRWAAVIAACAFAAVPFVNRAAAASILVVVLPAGVLLVSRTRWARWIVPALGALLIGAILTTAAIGVVSQGSHRRIRVVHRVSGIDSTRRALWHDAMRAVRAEPLRGVGPGRFSTASRLAGSDRDLRNAHNDFLQQAAEEGIPGLFFLVASFMWIFASIGSAGADTTASLGAVAVACLGLGASVDYLMHFPALIVCAAALSGAGAARERR